MKLAVNLKLLCPKIVMTSEAAFRLDWNSFEQSTFDETYGSEIPIGASVCFSWYKRSKSQWQ